MNSRTDGRMDDHRSDFGIRFESQDISNDEISEMIDASVTKHVQQQKVKRTARQATRQVSREQGAQKQARTFRFSAQGVLLCAATGKQAYDSQYAAEEAVRYIEAERYTKLSVYRCDLCGKWHLTSR
ncbi:MAG: hypothetical protein FWE48_06090 [Coriobacteriia bacterium]|nr:hypothetical protein [Coriobacteriia bacterium]MCL2746635.1 hypothetical protein [Coriobacteriia bacterium]MCL2870982.1 hypothetical protein [Coriobacteriia bacterium]